MAETKKPGAAAKVAPKPALLPASESGDVAVHNLLAERAAAVSSGDTAKAKQVTDALAELGYR